MSVKKVFSHIGACRRKFVVLMKVLSPVFAFHILKKTRLLGQTPKNLASEVVQRPRGALNRSSIRKILSSYIRDLGGLESYQIDYFVDKFIPDYKRAKDKLERGSRSWPSLKKYSVLAKYYGDHEFYTEAVVRVCGIKSLPVLKRVEFVGKAGLGSNTLDSYRKVETLDCQWMFEKVYKVKSDDFISLNFYLKYAYPVLSESFNVPGARIVEGSKGAVVYFDWINGMAKMNKKNILNLYSRFLDCALKVSVCSSECCGVVTDFTRVPMYKNGLKSLALLIHKNSPSKETDFILIKGLESYFRDLPVSERVFSHGDWAPTNIYENDTIVDFDSCGMYPVGYDLAYLSSRFLYFESFHKMEVGVGDVLNKFSLEGRLSFYFFALIFYSRAKRSVNSTDEFLMGLLLKLSEMADEIDLRI